LVLSFVEECQAFVGIGRRVLRSKLNRFVEVGDGLAVFTGGFEGFAEIVEGFWIFRLKLQGFAEAGNGFVKFLFLEKLESPVIELGSFGGNGLIRACSCFCGASETGD